MEIKILTLPYSSSPYPTPIKVSFAALHIFVSRKNTNTKTLPTTNRPPSAHVCGGKVSGPHAHLARQAARVTPLALEVAQSTNLAKFWTSTWSMVMVPWAVKVEVVKLAPPFLGDNWGINLRRLDKWKDEGKKEKKQAQKGEMLYIYIYSTYMYKYMHI